MVKLQESKILILTLFITVVLSGCVSQISEGLSSKSIGKIIKNPEKFEGEEINIKGVYDLGPVDKDYNYLYDEQGYKLKIKCGEENRNFEIGNKYEATGILKSFEKCKCQLRIYINITKEEFEKLNKTTISEPMMELSEWNNYSHWKIKKSECLNQTQKFGRKHVGYIKVNKTHSSAVFSPKIMEYRCASGSVQKEYYLKCTKPMKKL